MKYVPINYYYTDDILVQVSEVQRPVVMVQ